MATNIYLVKTLTQWPPNVARYKLLHGASVGKQHFVPLSNDVWQSPVYFSPSLVSGVTFVPAFGGDFRSVDSHLFTMHG